MNQKKINNNLDSENPLKESLEKMGQEMAEKAKEFDEIKKDFELTVPKDVIEASKRYQDMVAEVQKNLSPYSEMISVATKEWSKQQAIIIPVLEAINEPLKRVQEAVNESFKMHERAKFFLQDPPRIVISPNREHEISLELKELRKALQDLIAKNKKEKVEPPETPKLGKYSVFYTEDNVELKFNKENGNVKLGDMQSNIAPGTQEYKIFVRLLESSSCIADYKTLLKILYPGNDFKNGLKTYQVERWNLSSVINNIKVKLGILPKKNARNKDIFRTLRKQKAFSLSLKD